MDQFTVGKSLIAAETGEVIEDYGRIVDRVLVDREDFIGNIFSGDDVPIHLQLAKTLNIAPSVVQSYCGVEPVKSGEVKDRILKIIGCVPWFSGGFIRKADNQFDKGFHKVLFKLAETKERDIVIGTGTEKRIVTIRQNIIVATSAKRIVTYMSLLCESFGCFDWAEGNYVYAVINKSAETNAEEMIPVPEGMF